LLSGGVVKDSLTGLGQDGIAITVSAPTVGWARMRCGRQRDVGGSDR
jgi:hypothetical protein